jgi:acetyl-CoA synthetase
MRLEYRTYEEAKGNFRWSERWEVFDGNRERFNIAHECVSRHASEEAAIRIKFDDRHSEVHTFREFDRLVSQFANLLERLDLHQEDRIALLLPPSLEYYVSMFGTLKRGAVVVPCSPLFGPEAISFRIENSKAKAVVTSKNMVSLIEKKFAPQLQLIEAGQLRHELNSEKETYESDTSADTLAMIQFSSGTTGAPKAVMYRHGALTLSAPQIKFQAGLQPGDNFFCPSSPAWGHGIWFGTMSPLIFGRAIGAYSGKFDPEILLEALEEFEITNMSAISSHYRLIMNSGKIENYRLKIRRMTYTGEVMTMDVIRFFQERLGITPYCMYGTTEVGPICSDYAGFVDWKVKPGSLGKAMIGGRKIAVLDENGDELPPGKEGQIAVWNGSGWNKVEDILVQDEDGYFWYKCRADDVIISAGYTIGPVEIEEALKKHPAVIEVAVVGSPDKERGEVVKAFIKTNRNPSLELEEDIREFVKSNLSKHEYPREIEFTEELPKTPDGKVKRKELKERERKNKISLML